MTDRSNLVPSEQLSEKQALLMLGDESRDLAKQAKCILDTDFQQSINCCGFTSLAYALTALGCPTKVDDIFLNISVNVDSVVGDGMTLAELYDAAMRFIYVRKLPVYAECYHFDEQVIKEDGFLKACKAEGDSGMSDVMIFNFHSGIANGWESGGGGHFSLLMGLDSDSKKTVMSDVNGIKYGKYWAAPLSQLYMAMSDHDSCGRARGAIRLVKKDAKNVQRPIQGLTPSLVDWANPSSSYSNLAKYIPTEWDALLGARNMGGASAVASAVRIIEGDGSDIARMDAIMRALKESYTWHLDHFLPSSKVYSICVALSDAKLLSASVSEKKIEGNITAAALRKALVDVGCGKDGVAVMVSYDFNRAIGFDLLPAPTGEAAALSHGNKTWSLIASFDEKASEDDSNGVIIAPAHNVILAGRMWSCSLSALASGIEPMGVDHSSLVVLTKNA